jgi:glycosyltransferase involved in cell wall biosynthesis
VTGRPSVVHLVRAFQGGGIETLLLATLPRMRDAGFDVRLLCIARDEGEQAAAFRAAGLAVEHLPVRSRWSPAGLLRLRGALRSAGADLLHTHGYAQNVTGTAAGLLAGVPVVAHAHGFLEWKASPKRRRMERMLTRWRRAVIACSAAVRDELLEAGLDRRKVVLLPNAADLGRFRPRETSRLSKPPVIGVLGSLSPAKGHDILLEAMTLLQREGHRPEAWFIGDGERRASLEEEAARRGLAGRVRFLGHRSDVPDLLPRLDVMAFPSRSEGFGLAVVEAQASGVPVVTARTGGLEEVVADGDSGLLVPPGDAAALATALERLLEDEGLRETLRAGGLASAASYDIGPYVERLVRLYGKVLALP